MVGLLGWGDALFVALVLLAPLVFDALAAAKGLPVTWPVVPWLSAGFGMLWSDWLVNREDVDFHLGVAVDRTALENCRTPR